ncbi:hypothetical protein HPB48_005843 [Haemaphysalis longicornis]|uniref:Uncharacterized protein n=1 Tax=Haemaphysalis longicornis TaxID=44386 RepID=A0A9J6GPR5_HAELO|nr:hypothetical protein HPB48_005843 [Haemaphysalis longicornis]
MIWPGKERERESTSFGCASNTKREERKAEPIFIPTHVPPMNTARVCFPPPPVRRPFSSFFVRYSRRVSPARRRKIRASLTERSTSRLSVAGVLRRRRTHR